MTSTHTSSTSLVEQLASPPKISLQIRGTHTSNETEVVDFDFWIDYSEKATIKSGAFLTRNEIDTRSWNHSTSEDSPSFQTIASNWIDDWLGDSNDNHGRTCTLQTRVSVHDDEPAAIKVHVERLARGVAYGGTIQGEIYTLPIEQVNILPEEYTAVVRVEWSLDSPSMFIPTEQTWDQMVMNAMVDHKRGFISVDTPRPSYGMSPFRRAMRANNTSTVISQERDRNGGGYSVRQFEPWGSDGCS